MRTTNAFNTRNATNATSTVESDSIVPGSPRRGRPRGAAAPAGRGTGGGDSVLDGGTGNVLNGAALDRWRCPADEAPDVEALPDCDLKGKKNREPPELGPDERVRGMVEEVRSK